MGFVKDTLFGKQAKSNSTTPTGFQTLADFTGAQDALTSALSQGQNLAANTSLFTPQPFTGQQNVALNNLQNVFTPGFNFGQKADAALGRVAGQVDMANNFLNQGGQQIGLANQYTSQGVNPITGQEISQNIDYFMNPFTGQVVDRAVGDIRDEGARQGSQIGSLASTAGAFGGTRQALLESELGRNLQRSVGDVSGQLRAQGFESAATKALQNLTQGRDRYLTGAGTALQGAGQFSNLAQGANQGASIFNDLGRNFLSGRELMGNLSRQSNMDALQAGDIARGLTQQQQQVPLAQQDYMTQLLRNLVLPLAQGGQQSTERGATDGLLKSGAGLGGLAQAGSGIASGLSALFSDASLKENIEKVGNKNGFNLYEFNYIGDGVRYRGVMAHEVREIMPEAVKDEFGFMKVNYNMIGVPMEAA